MPLHNIEKMEFVFEGEKYAAKRLIFRVGSGKRLYQVLDLGGRQIVDEGAYLEKDVGQMMCAAKDLLLAHLMHREAC